MLKLLIKFISMSIKRIFKAVAILTIFSIITRVLGFVFRIYLSRSLSPTDLGIYQIVLSVFGIFCALVSSGFPLIISRKTAEFSVSKNTTAEHRYMLASLIVGLCVSAISCLCIFVFKAPFVKFLKSEQIYTLLIYLMPAIFFSSIYSTFRGNMWGHKNYFWVCLIELFEQVIRILVCFILFSKATSSTFKTDATVLSLSIACVASGILSFFVYFAKGGRLKKPKNEYREILKSATPITFMRVMQSLIQPLISIIIPIRLIAGGMSHATAIGEIGIVLGMTFPLLFIPSSIVGSLATALIPEISAKNFEGDSKEIKNQISSSLNFALICSFILVPIYIALGKHIGVFVYNNANSGIYLASSAFLMIPICLNTIASSTLNSLGLEKQSFKNYIIGSVLMLASIWFLPKYISLHALSVGMGVCLFCSTILNIRLINKKLKCKLKTHQLALKLASFSVFLTFLTKFTFNILIRFCPLFLSLFLSCLICVVCFAVLLDIFSIVKIYNLFVRFKRKKIFSNSKWIK